MHDAGGGGWSLPVFNFNQQAVGSSCPDIVCKFLSDLECFVPPVFWWITYLIFYPVTVAWQSEAEYYDGSPGLTGGLTGGITAPYFHNNPACVPPVHYNFYHASPHQADCPAWLSKGRDCQGWPCLVGPGGAILCCGAHSLSTEMIILIVLLTFLCWLLIPATPPCHLLPVL